jgi:TatD DNase family protein
MNALTDYIDIHTHSVREKEFFVQNIFAQNLTESYHFKNPSTIGLHPWHLAETDCDLAIGNLLKFARYPHVVGIGECGLDKNINIPFEEQIKYFLLQLEIAEQVDKPAIIHCVKAYSEILHIRKKKNWKIPWLFHWFNSSIEIANDLISAGCFLSFGKSLLNEKGMNAEVFKKIPLNFIFFETDDAPVSIESIYERAASLKAMKLENVMKQVKENYKKIFTE